MRFGCLRWKSIVTDAPKGLFWYACILCTAQRGPTRMLRQNGPSKLSFGEVQRLRNLGALSNDQEYAASTGGGHETGRALLHALLGSSSSEEQLEQVLMLLAAGKVGEARLQAVRMTWFVISICFLTCFLIFCLPVSEAFTHDPQ